MAKKDLLFYLAIGLMVLFFLLVFTSGQNYLPNDNNKQYAAYYESFSEMQSLNATQMSNDINSTLSPVDSSENIKHGYVTDSNIIDPISNAATNEVDGNVCTGLTNRGGAVCLTPEMADLLKTRGGNASGK
jgi:hypothetical protein